jgi:hypothetical protein
MMRRPSLLLAGAALVALAAGIWTWRLVVMRRGGGPDRAVAQVGTTMLTYAPAYARFPSGRGGGRLDRLELAVTFPDFRAAGGATSALPPDDEADPSRSTSVVLTIRPEDEAIDPEERTEKLHARFLESGVWQEDAGLVMRRFEKGSPYDHEELHFAPPDGRAFAARCMRPTQPPSDLPSTCLSTIRTEGLDVDLRFPPAILPQWKRLIEGAQRLVQSFRGG